MSTVFSKVLAFAVGVASSVGAMAIPALAAPTAEAPPAAQTGVMWKGDGTFKPHDGIDLGRGKIVESTDAKLFAIRHDANEVPLGLHFQFVYEQYFTAKAVFPIRQLGQTTGYWLQTGVYNAHPVHRVRATCEVFDRDPSTPGAKPVGSSPFECATTRRGILDNDFDFTVGVAGSRGEASGTIHTTGTLSLTAGQYRDNRISFFVKGAESVPVSGQTRFSSVLRKGDPATDQTRAEFQYTILDNGTVTPYTVRGWNNSRGDQECTVHPAGTYACTASGRFPSLVHWDGTFIVGIAGLLAEASGTITPTNVALKDGNFRTDTGYHHLGATELAPGESTRFNAILAEGDEPFYENQARTEWAYQIVDADVETGIWVAGLATNHRGTVKFSADGRCAIYHGNPLEGKGRLDWQKPIENTPYTCATTGEMLHGPGEDDNRHFDAIHIVTRK